ncbi:MAG: MATE family efflux transporter [Sphingomonadaceae bacterium]
MSVQQLADFRRDAILHGPVIPTMLALALPTLIVIAAQTFVAVLEAYWISRLGTDAVAGVSLVLPLFVLMGTMSNGGIGGGVSSAIARAIGGGRAEDANALLAHSVLIAVLFGAAFMGAMLYGGPSIYAALGGNGAAMVQALAYSHWVFGLSVPIWLVNLISSALRGAGEVKLPARISLLGALLLIPLVPALMFGFGPLPRLEIAGAGIALGLYYGGALAVLLRYVLRGKGVLTLSMHPPIKQHVAAIMGVGLISALGTLTASLTTVAITGIVGGYGAAPLAGFGIASRVDSLLVPLLFGLGTAVVTMIGIATGAGDAARARKVAWTAAALAFGVTEAIGVLLFFAPQLWNGIFSTDPEVLQAGNAYFAAVAPVYGLIGLGLVLFFACQGRGKMAWPFTAGIARLILTALGAWALASAGASLPLLFIAVTAGAALFGAINAYGFWRSS